MKRLFALTGGAKLVTETFTTSTTWTAPLTTAVIGTLTGEGADGTPATVQSAAMVSCNVTYYTSGSGTPGSGPVQWTQAQSGADTVRNTLNAGGAAVTFNTYQIDAYPDGTNYLTEYAQYVEDVVAGSAYDTYSGGWQSSGPIAASGWSTVHYDYVQPAFDGANTTGFGKTFAGGVSGGAATPVTYNNVAVTPGAAYTLVIPAGGSITITYYK